VSLEISGGSAGQARIVLVVAQPKIAVAAEEAAHDAGGMIMIDGQGLVGLVGLTDEADAVLLRQQGVVVRERHPVPVLEPLLAVVARAGPRHVVDNGGRVGLRHVVAFLLLEGERRASAAAPGSNIPADQAAIIASFWRMRPLL
jgi:hypothetical protein